MEYAVSILMLAFSLAILFYAGILALTKNYNMLPYRSRVSVKPKDPKRYALQLSKVIALAALAPALGSLAGLWHSIAAIAVFVGALIVLLWIGVKLMRGVE